MKKIKNIIKIMKWLQLIVAAILTFMMVKAMKMLFIIFKEEGLF